MDRCCTGFSNTNSFCQRTSQNVRSILGWSGRFFLILFLQNFWGNEMCTHPQFLGFISLNITIAICMYTDRNSLFIEAIKCENHHKTKALSYYSLLNNGQFISKYLAHFFMNLSLLLLHSEWFLNQYSFQNDAKKSQIWLVSLA